MADSASNNPNSLSMLARSLMEADEPEMKMDRHVDHSDHADHDEGCAHGWWVFIFYFLVIALVLYFLFFALRPSFVMKDNHSSSSDSHSLSDDLCGEIDNGRLLGSAIVGALLLMFVFWLLTWLARW